MSRAVIAHPAIGLRLSAPEPSQISSRIPNAVQNVRFFPSSVALTKASPITIVNSIQTVEKHAKRHNVKTVLDTADKPIQSLKRRKPRKVSTTNPLSSACPSNQSSINYGKAAATLESIYTGSPSLEAKTSKKTISLLANTDTRPLQQDISAAVKHHSLPEALNDDSVGHNNCDRLQRGEGEGSSRQKQRLDLRTRATLRTKRLDRLRRSLQTKTLETNESEVERSDIWSAKADQLVKSYGGTLSLMAQDWEKLSYELLTPEEENWLATVMLPMKQLEKLRTDLYKQLGEQFSEEQWAKAAHMDVGTLQRLISLGKAARRKLSQLNLRLVLYQAYKYYRRELSLSVIDLCQEGVKGLILAVDKFDPQKGFRFSTYAIYWIRNAMTRAQIRSGHLLRAPFKVAELKLTIKKIALELLWETGRSPTHEEIIRRLGIHKDRYVEVLRTGRKIVSLNEPDKITGNEHVETIADPAEEGRKSSELCRYLRGETIQRLGLDDVLDSLKPKESLVLRQRFGLDGKGERSLGEIGRNLNMSREMARKYEVRGLLKLKHPMRLAYLRSFLI